MVRVVREKGGLECGHIGEVGTTEVLVGKSSHL